LLTIASAMLWLMPGTCCSSATVALLTSTLAVGTPPRAITSVFGFCTR
jgi:hypothetical protein